MNDRFSFIIKILVVSAILSLAIKYGGPLLSLEPTVPNASIGIFIPPTIMGLALWWREKANI